MSLISLPAELQLMICCYLSCSDLAHMVLCSKSFHFASRALYENISIRLDKPLIISVNQILQPTNLLRATEALASLVKTVRLSQPYSSRVPDPTSVQDGLFCEAMMRVRCGCPLTASRKHKLYCSSRFEQLERFKFVPQRLLDSCPNVAKLEFIGFAPSNWAHSLEYSKMQSLREIAITDAEELSQVMLEQIAALPRLRSLCLSFDGFRPSGTAWTPPVLKTLTTMKVVTGVKLLKQLQTLLLVAPNLTRLDLELDLGMMSDMLYFGTPDFAEGRPLSVLGRALRGQLGSNETPFPAPADSASPLFNLEHLRLMVSFEPRSICSDIALLQRYGFGPIPLEDRRVRLREALLAHDFDSIYTCSLRGSIGPLSDLRKLQTLEISPALLFGRKGRRNLSGLPPSLRELRLRDDPITWKTFEGSDDVLGQWWMPYYRALWIPAELDAILRRYAEDKEQHLPHLEQIIGLSRLVGDPSVELSSEPDAEVVRMLTDLGTKYEIRPMIYVA